MQAMLRSLAGGTIAAVRYAILRSMLHGSPKALLHSIEVVDLIGGNGIDQRFALVDAALDLISEREPRRLGRLRSDISRVVFLESGPEFWPHGRVCILHDVSRLTAEEVALHLIHEGMHARLSRCGIGYEQERRGRIEVACIRQELEFLRRLPAAEELVAQTTAKLKADWWSSASMHDRHRETLESAEAPNWVVKLYDRKNHDK